MKNATAKKNKVDLRYWHEKKKKKSIIHSKVNTATQEIIELATYVYIYNLYTII